MVDYIKNIKDIDVSANENEIGSLQSKLVSENNEGIKEGISKNIELLETELNCLKNN